MNQILTRILACACLILLLNGCASTEEADETRGMSEVEIYTLAKDAQKDKNYEQSIKLFEKLEARFPYGRFAQQAQLEIAYTYFKDSEHALAIVAVERFMRQYPRHQNMDYAYYLRGLISFNEEQGFLSLLVKQDMSERDPKNNQESFEAFKTLVNRFPDSKYAPDAYARMDYLIGAMADYEMHVARYYFRRGAFLAAANRAKALLENYGQTKQVEQALGVMVLAYDKLGMSDLRDDAKRVLLKNYPNTKILEEVFEEDRWWWLPI